MNMFKNVHLFLVAALFMFVGRSWAEDAAPAQEQAASAEKPAAAAAKDPAAPAQKPAAKPAMAAKSQAPAGPTMKDANALAAAGKTEEAIAAYEKLGVQKTKKGEAWRLNNEGLAYLQASEPDAQKALPLFEKAVATDASNAVAWNNLGTVYEETKQYDKAKDAYQKSIDAAKAANNSSAKAQNNLQSLQARLDKKAAKSANSGSNKAKSGASNANDQAKAGDPAK
jgi:tetratricopeptide (TPR) repeat protein